MRPDVSVLMPAYNVEAFIEEAITSCLAQTMGSLELIVVDDGSTDRTAAVVQAFRDPRIRLIRTPTNRGQAYARNRTLDAARGTWLAVLDADDLWEDTRLEELLRFGTRFGENAVLFDISRPFVVDRRGHHRPLDAKRSQETRESVGDHIVELDPIEFVRRGSAGHPMFSLSLVAATGARYLDGVIVAADTAFYVQLLNAEYARVFRVKRALYHYRVRPGAVTGSANRLQEIQRTHHLLLEKCMLSKQMQAAIEDRLKVLDRELAFEYLRASLGTARWGAALRLLRKDPRLAALLVGRATRSVEYRLRLAAWGSDGRG